MKTNKKEKIILGTFALVGLLPFIVFGLAVFFVLFVLPAPLELIRFHRSAYYKDGRGEYAFGITYREDYRLYKLLKERGVKTEIVHSANGVSYLSSENGVYIFMDSYHLDFNAEQGQWEIDGETQRLADDDLLNSDEPLNLNTFIEKIMGEFDSNLQQVRLLVRRKQLDKRLRSVAQTEPRFVVFNKIKGLCDDLFTAQKKDITQ